MPQIYFTQTDSYVAEITEDELAQIENGEMPAEELLGDLIARGKAHWKNGQTDYEAVEE